MNEPTVEEMEHAQAKKATETREQIMATALSQPHRRRLVDPESKWAESELGRFCLANKLRKEIYDAGIKYQTIYDLHCAAWGAPCQRRSGGGSGTGQGPTMRTVAEWRATLESCAKALMQGGGAAGLRAAKQLCFDDIEVAPLDTERTIFGLMELARELGFGALRSPFE